MKLVKEKPKGIVFISSFVYISDSDFCHSAL